MTTVRVLIRSTFTIAAFAFLLVVTLFMGDWENSLCAF